MASVAVVSCLATLFAGLARVAWYWRWMPDLPGSGLVFSAAPVISLLAGLAGFFTVCLRTIFRRPVPGDDWVAMRWAILAAVTYLCLGFVDLIVRR